MLNSDEYWTFLWEENIEIPPHGNRVLWSFYKLQYLTYKFSRLISNTFPKEFMKRICLNQRIFPWVIILSILITFSLDNVLLFLGEELMGEYLANRGYIFGAWAVAWKVVSANNCSYFYCACAKFVKRFTCKISRRVCRQTARVSQE